MNFQIYIVFEILREIEADWTKLRSCLNSQALDSHEMCWEVNISFGWRSDSTKRVHNILWFMRLLRLFLLSKQLKFEKLATAMWPYSLPKLYCLNACILGSLGLESFSNWIIEECRIWTLHCVESCGRSFYGLWFDFSFLFDVQHRFHEESLFIKKLILTLKDYSSFSILMSSIY
jgi:hypothetical protein